MTEPALTTPTDTTQDEEVLDAHDEFDRPPNLADEVPGVADPAEQHDPERPERPHYSLPRPGHIAGAEHKISIETLQGVALVLGRPARKGKETILGLYMFGGKIHDVWQAAANDDPYADWVLWQIHEFMEREKKQLAAEEKRVDGLLVSQRGITFGDAHSVEPVELNLGFSTPFGFKGAMLVVDYDNLVRKTLTAQLVGLLTRRQAMEAIIYTRGRRLRHMFQLPTQWKYTGVNRDDVRRDTQRAATARDRMGDLPQAVLDGSQRAPNAPRMRTPRPEDDVRPAPDSTDREAETEAE